MIQTAALLAILEHLERSSRVVTVRFLDGEVLDLRIISTAHVEEGDDVVAEVVHKPCSPTVSDRYPNGAFIDFFLPEVEEIRLDGACVFLRQTTT